ncbi:NAD-dependent succinate-semialdehyde dehydrogenase [Acinetobacter terrae]|uniref:NAD-dependent succinate-semialdehyde dehydrogenase n=1 Tax=Acinetobacter terrae TaxID=2731247 RepID=UPI0007D85582|nr:NAD-dependent succinate-semialdehyde dehydrogenase [Acinetobacter terrae]OAL84035.1 NAD-dependent succinate-semialdehyde dehydrogenase [Acinetobacter terrae]
MQYSQYISGSFRQGTSKITYDVLNPATAESLGQLTFTSPTDIEEAIQSAKQAYIIWSKTTAYDRSLKIRQIANLIYARVDELAEQITLELGKPFAEARKEVQTAAEMFEWASEEARRIYGKTIPPRTANIKQTIVYEPVGVVAAFSGWNAPAITPARKISAALAAGCSIVIKPSEETAGIALKIAQIIDELEFPKGVINMVFGNPEEISNILCESPDIAMITFTGATSIGKSLAEKASKHLKKLTLELGGHAPVIICEDVDVEKVVKAAVAAKYRNAGQVCTSPTRFLIHQSIFTTFSEKFAEYAKQIKVGNPFDAQTQMGPLKNVRRLDAIDQLVQNARELGVEISAGGEKLKDLSGCFYAPTVIVQPNLDAQVNHIEPFGPIAILRSFNDLDEALTEANRLPFGLAAYAFTNNFKYIERISNEIESGVISINDWQASLPETPFGGVKDSGLGIEGGAEGIHEFLKIKTVRIAH